MTTWIFRIFTPGNFPAYGNKFRVLQSFISPKREWYWSAQVILDELGPDFVGLPNGVEVALSFRGGNIFEEDAIKKNKGGHAFVCGAVNEDAAVIEGIHNAAEGPEVLRGGRLEINRDVNVRHAEAGYKTAFVWECVVGSWQCEIDYGFKSSLADLSKLLLGRLASGREFGAKRPEVVDVRERRRIHVLRGSLPQGSDCCQSRVVPDPTGPGASDGTDQRTATLSFSPSHRFARAPRIMRALQPASTH